MLGLLAGGFSGVSLWDILGRSELLQAPLWFTLVSLVNWPLER